jgi:hypothetical protein
MDVTCPVESPLLSLRCPHCQHEEDDTLECLDDQQVLRLHCANCERLFHFAVMECEDCGTEVAHSWSEAPGEDVLASLRCATCQHVYLQHYEAQCSVPGPFA